MNNPLFSVITVTYNAESTIVPTIRSVKEQTAVEYEHLIVDGASQDRTLDLIRKEAGGSVRVVSEPDQGLYDAMNKGIGFARGDYLIFLNSGDTFHAPSTLSELSHWIREIHPDILYGETALVDADRRFIGMRRLKTPDRLTWKSFRYGMLVCHQSFVVRRSMAPKYDLNYRFSADFDWCIRCLKRADTVVNTRLILTDYLNEGLTTRNHKASLKERFRIMTRYYGWLSVAVLHIWFAFRYYFSKWFLGRV